MQCTAMYAMKCILEHFVTIAVWANVWLHLHTWRPALQMMFCVRNILNCPIVTFLNLEFCNKMIWHHFKTNCECFNWVIFELLIVLVKKLFMTVISIPMSKVQESAVFFNQQMLLKCCPRIKFARFCEATRTL